MDGYVCLSSSVQKLVLLSDSYSSKMELIVVTPLFALFLCALRSLLVFDHGLLGGLTANRYLNPIFSHHG